MEYKFETIAFNSTAKKLPEDSDRQHYIGLEHLDSNSLYVSRWGSDVTPIGEKLLMKKGDILWNFFGAWNGTSSEREYNGQRLFPVLYWL